MSGEAGRCADYAWHGRVLAAADERGIPSGGTQSPNPFNGRSGGCTGRPAPMFTDADVDPARVVRERSRMTGSGRAARPGRHASHRSWCARRDEHARPRSARPLSSWAASAGSPSAARQSMSRDSRRLSANGLTRRILFFGYPLRCPLRRAPGSDDLRSTIQVPLMSSWRLVGSRPWTANARPRPCGAPSRAARPGCCRCPPPGPRRPQPERLRSPAGCPLAPSH
jgi:hypothetical protein